MRRRGKGGRWRKGGTARRGGGDPRVEEKMGQSGGSGETRKGKAGAKKGEEDWREDGRETLEGREDKMVREGLERRERRATRARG